VTARITGPAACLASVPRALRRVIRRAQARLEAPTREAIGMPAGHPELLSARIPMRQAVWLAEVSERLWPHNEYAQIVRDTRPEANP
jgi:hypothetical protein